MLAELFLVHLSEFQFDFRDNFSLQCHFEPYFHQRSEMAPHLMRLAESLVTASLGVSLMECLNPGIKENGVP